MTTLDQYFSELTACLNRLTPAERAEAISYYTEYAAEAGITDYDGMTARFGSPRTLAAAIYSDTAAKHVQGPGDTRRSVSRGFLISLAALAALPLSLPVLLAVGSIALALLISLGSVFLSLLASAAALIGAGVFSLFHGFSYLIPFRAGPLLMSLGGGLALGALGCAGLLLLLWAGRGLLTHGTLAVTRFIDRRTSHEV